MKMRGTDRQTQHSRVHRWADIGATGFGWMTWALGRIFLPSRPMRIGLSGLLLWVGVAGMTLADEAPSQTRSSTKSKSKLGTIKDPFNPQGYMLEMAAKMRAADPSDAVLGETGILRSHPTSAKAVPLTPATSKVTWLSPGSQTGQPEAATPPPSGSHVRWLSPKGQAIQAPAPSEPTSTQMGWRPPRNQTTSGTITPEPGLGQTRWLTGTPEVARQPAPSEPVTGQMGWRPSRNQVTPKNATSQPSIGHTRWLTPSPQATRQPAPVAPATPTIPAPNQMTWSPPVTQGPPRSALPETPLVQTHWLTPAPKVTRPPTPAQPVTRQMTASPVMPQAASRSVLPETPMHQTRWLAPTTQPAPQPASPVVNQTAGSATGNPIAQQPAPTNAALDKKTWLAPENRAAQLALDKIHRRESGPAENPATTATREAIAQAFAQSIGGTPQLTPRQLELLNGDPASQMLLLSRETANPQTALLADDPTTYAAADLSQARNFYEQEARPWSLGTDLDQYRAHAVREGTRDTGASLGKALERIGLAIEDTTNVITLGYASDRGEPFRTNDGEGLFEAPERVPMQVGATAASLGNGLYSVVDLITFDGLPNSEQGVYQDNHPIVRPLIFTGRTIGGVWKTTEEIGNAVTWGYFDNVTGSIGMCIEDLIEVLKHAGQAVTNLARVPVHLVAGKDTEGADKALDWVLLVPLEFASNVVEMKGIANTDDYETAFADKGVIGSLLEFGGSTFIVYRAVDELIDELKDDDHSHKQSNDNSVEPEPEPEPVPDVPVDLGDPLGTWTDFVFTDDGVWVGTRAP